VWAFCASCAGAAADHEDRFLVWPHSQGAVVQCMWRRTGIIRWHVVSSHCFEIWDASIIWKFLPFESFIVFLPDRTRMYKFFYHLKVFNILQRPSFYHWSGCCSLHSPLLINEHAGLAWTLRQRQHRLWGRPSTTLACGWYCIVDMRKGGVYIRRRRREWGGGSGIASRYDRYAPRVPHIYYIYKYLYKNKNILKCQRKRNIARIVL
jgi:hypothetical protein